MDEKDSYTGLHKYEARPIPSSRISYDECKKGCSRKSRIKAFLEWLID